MANLGYCFYNRCVLEVAKDLLGKLFVFDGRQTIITETEGYRGFDDEASHAYKGITKRCALMFGAPGRVYIYMVYGMHYCINIVTQEAGSPSAVLIRGLMLSNIHLDGPGKVCRYLGITTKENGIDLLANNRLFIQHSIKLEKITTTKRIGITKAIDKPWRFLADIDEVKAKSHS